MTRALTLAALAAYLALSLATALPKLEDYLDDDALPVAHPTPCVSHLAAKVMPSPYASPAVKDPLASPEASPAVVDPFAPPEASPAVRDPLASPEASPAVEDPMIHVGGPVATPVVYASPEASPVVKDLFNSAEASPAVEDPFGSPEASPVVVDSLPSPEATPAVEDPIVHADGPVVTAIPVPAHPVKTPAAYPPKPHKSAPAEQKCNISRVDLSAGTALRCCEERFACGSPRCAGASACKNPDVCFCRATVCQKVYIHFSTEKTVRKKCAEHFVAGL